MSTSPNVIRVMCPNLSCRRVLAVPDHARGKIVRCRECGTNVRIPAGGAAPAEKSPAAPAAPGAAGEAKAA